MLDYRTAVAELPRPTPSQIEAFVEYVFDAHSWYKHLPRFGRGRPFTFYVDPCAGYRLRNYPDGTSELIERVEGEHFFHYNELPTRTYRARFGHLAYATAYGTRVALVDPARGAELPELAGAGARSPLMVLWPEHGMVEVPSSLSAVGTVTFTAVIHALADAPHIWSWSERPLLTRSWPEESGGRATLERLAEIVEQAKLDQDGSFKASWAVQTEPWEGKLRHRFDLHEIVGPERDRQKHRAVRAIGAMLDQLFAS